MAGRLPRVTGAVGSVDTAGQGYFFAVFISPTSASTQLLIATEEVRAVQFVLPFRATVNRIVTEVTTTGGSGKKYGLGLYSADGQTLLTETGALDANSATTNITTITQITFEPGVYWFAWTSDSTTVKLRGGAVTSGVLILDTLTTKRSVVAGNSPSPAGVLPSSLGTMTTGSSTVPPFAVFTLE